MKKNLFYAFAAATLLVFVSCKSSSEKPAEEATVTESSGSGESLTGQRYSLKSAKVTSVMELPGGMGSTTSILYFDDHGEKEMRETKTGVKVAGHEMNTVSRVIIQDGYIYTWTVGQAAGNKIKLGDRFDPSNVDYKKLTKEMMEQFKMKDEGTATVLDKTCRVFSFEAQGMKGKSYVWENIPMKTEMAVAGKNMTSEVTSLEENISIPASEFELPANVEFKELQVPQAMNP